MADTIEQREQAVLDALIMQKIALVEGPGSVRKPLPGVVCHRCFGQHKVVYTGSDVLEGKLGYSHLVATEVNHQLICLDCGNGWTVFQRLSPQPG